MNRIPIGSLLESESDSKSNELKCLKGQPSAVSNHDQLLKEIIFVKFECKIVNGRPRKCQNKKNYAAFPKYPEEEETPKRNNKITSKQ